MRRTTAVVAIAACCLLAAACGGGGKKSASSPSTTAAASDPGRAVVQKLVAAAARKDAHALWNLLSSSSQKRLGPSFAVFASIPAGKMERALSPFESGYQTLVSARITNNFGVVTIARGQKLLAFTLRGAPGSPLKIEATSPIAFQILGPQPGSSQPVAQVGVEVHANGGVGAAIVFVDGVPYLNPHIAASQKAATVFVNLPKKLKPGVHSATVFAQLGDDAASLAWAFRAT